MIDIHSHILPGIDDGAKTIEDSLDMARVAAREGIRSIIATPHHQNGQWNNERDRILLKVEEVNQAIVKEGIDVKILPGQEVRLYGELLGDLAQGTLQTLNSSSYLFIEFPSSSVPRYAKQMLFDLQLQGITPVIVHPERNAELIERPSKLYDFVNNGALTQVTAASVAGAFGKKIQKFSFDLVKANLTHFVASDAHNTTTRGFKMSEAFDLIEKKFGPDAVYFFKENAELLVDGQNVMKNIPEKIEKKKFLGLF
ncbi:tyrosine protein phosphatase [Bacillus coahuilensis m2-6]|uniref:Tyrosine-protein phosphatase n=1 Tax=Bacillus coahuilensis p1.1.43 TaxID=1150625 RepID=A0A147K4K8_9BACI|nr:CpsB/CapC family capsule biosynthesis tyrosine phosphatase [Bacillus coahuilensis]KUP04308.1 tyrosine protein phosphatase [Bacillus coahuilensis p1.1.43]KUP05100.1 tyrosine protein phosphatase [Bacillus coahuilensis m2-6]